MIGGFQNGRGEFYCQDMWKGKAVLVRFIWTETNTKSPHFEQSYSGDGGRTWEVNWITNQERVQARAGLDGNLAGQRDAALLLGQWQAHRRFQNGVGALYSTGTLTWETNRISDFRRVSR